PGTPISATMLCQNVGETEFRADSVPVVNVATGAAETLVFGAAPDAGVVKLEAGDGKVVATNAIAAPQGSDFPARSWVLAIPPGHKSAHLDSIAEDGEKLGTIDGTRYLDQLAAWQRSVADAY